MKKNVILLSNLLPTERNIDMAQYHYIFYQMHRMYIYSGIPHSSGGLAQ